MTSQYINLVLWMVLLFHVKITVPYQDIITIENPENALFLTELSSHHNSGSVILQGEDANHLLISSERFLIVKPNEPLGIRATYGPLNARQTIPGKYAAHDNLDTHNDVTAHLITTEVSRDNPVVRVLFHTGILRRKVPVMAENVDHETHFCVQLEARSADSGLKRTTACEPNQHEQTCLATLVIPTEWWFGINRQNKKMHKGKKPIKSVKNTVELLYSVYEVHGKTCATIKGVPSTQLLPSMSVGNIVLKADQESLVEIVSDSNVKVVTPDLTLYPQTNLYATVLANTSGLVSAAWPITLTVRAKVADGAKILGAEAGSSVWGIESKIDSSETEVSVVATLLVPPKHISHGEDEVVRVLLQVFTDDAHTVDCLRTVWSWDWGHGPKRLNRWYQKDESSKKRSARRTRKKRAKFPAFQQDEAKIEGCKLPINKDTVQAVVPMVKVREIVNTAVLTGHPVTRPFKVYMVSQAGQVADVTLQAACSSADESILKVSPSCTSVYVDGGEVRGSSNASVQINYGAKTSSLSVTVWYPELPVYLELDDPILGMIPGWRVPHGSSFDRDKRQLLTTKSLKVEKSGCRMRYQQTGFEVYSRFHAESPDSGRVAWLGSRRTHLRVTQLVSSHTRIGDPRLATITSGYVEGLRPGRTDLQVYSPITGRILGTTEVRVTSEQTEMVGLQARLLTGIDLVLEQDGQTENSYSALAHASDTLNARYQEGILDLQLQFSDGSSIPLHAVDKSQYHLVITSLNTSIVAVAPAPSAMHRIIAISGGRGDLVKIRLELSDECQRKKWHPLAVSMVHVEVSVDYFTPIQNDAERGGRSKDSVNLLTPDLSDIIDKGFPNHDQHGDATHRRDYPNATALEAAMYFLLAVFSIAIGVFVVACVMYASKQRRAELPLPADTESHAHDWVWLGRAHDTPDIKNPKVGSKKYRHFGVSSLASSVPRTVDSSTYTKRSPRVIDNPSFGLRAVGSSLSATVPPAVEFEVRTNPLSYDVLPVPTTAVTTFSRDVQTDFPSSQHNTHTLDTISDMSSPTSDLSSPGGNQRISLVDFIAGNSLNEPIESVKMRNKDDHETRRIVRSWLLAGEAIPKDLQDLFNSETCSEPARKNIPEVRKTSSFEGPNSEPVHKIRPDFSIDVANTSSFETAHTIESPTSEDAPDFDTPLSGNRNYENLKIRKTTSFETPKAIESPSVATVRTLTRSDPDLVEKPFLVAASDSDEPIRVDYDRLLAYFNAMKESTA